MKKIILNQRSFETLCRNVLSLFVFVLLSTTVIQAQTQLTGKVTDAKQEAIVGATVMVKGQQKGTVTNLEGKFSISADNNAILIISSVGYKNQEVSVSGRSTINVVLVEDIESLDEVVVTGVFDKRSRMESSVAISVLNTKQLSMVVPNSAADLLKNIPGVYVNSALGEIRNAVYSRGVVASNDPGALGYYYVSMQEDGLPVTNATFGNYGPDYFLRADATIGKVEAVRGGTASILGNNAPGGIFNYVSKTGGTTFAGEVRAKYGLEGDGKNPFYRTDINFDGPLSKDKSLTYNIGGFWRQSDGARNPGYPMNNGGQIKGNIVKKYKGGTFKLYAKYLDDHNAWFESLPTIGFENPRLPAGIEQTNSVLIPSVQTSFKINDSGETRNFDSRDKVHSKDISVGFNIEHNFGDGWTVENKIRYSDKSSVWNTTGIVFPFALDNLIYYYIIGQLGQFGTYKFNDLSSGKNLATVMQTPNIVNGQFAGFNFPVINSSLPGESAQKNSLLFNPLLFQENGMKELVNQFTITKRLKNMSFTAGGFYAHSDLHRLNGAAGSAFSTIQTPHPELTDISYTDFAGKVYQLTGKSGVLGGGNGASSSISIYDVTQNQTALFLGHNWSINEKLNFDWGVRFENVAIKGVNQIATGSPSTDGGIDKNPLTLYDNGGGKIGATYSYDKSVKTFSISAGLNYKFNENLALYGRYSNGEKAPDMNIFINVNTEGLNKFLNPLSQNIKQLEMGLKMKNEKMSLFITPFYSVLDNVPTQQLGQETADLSTIYATPVLYNKFETKGLEIEGNYRFTNTLSVRSVATFQSSTAVNYQTWILGANGKADDKIQDYSGNETDNTAKTMIRITPTYSNDKIFASVEWSYMGSRAANVANAFYLPSFDQTNINLGYNVTKNVQIQGNINNIFNQIGIMGWSAPGGFPAALDTQGFTKATKEANPNAVYSTTSVPPRAYFIALNYKF
ncbi:MAG: TonB-dependent receptor [Bacteroidota bacterium]